MSKGMKILLGLSLALNLIFIGLAGSAFWKVKHFRHGHHKGAYIAQRLIRDFPKQRQQELLSGFENIGEEIRKARKNAGGSWKRVGEVLEKEPFDADQMRETLAALRNSHAVKRQVISERFIAMLEKMTPQERKLIRQHKLFRRIMRGGGRYSRKRH